MGMSAVCNGSYPRKILALLLGMALGCAILAQESRAHDPGARGFASAELDPLLESLEKRGYPREFLDKIFSDSRLKRVRRVIGLNAINQESERIYRDFLSPYAIRLARRFQRRHQPQLAHAERAYGVPRNILVAVLLVETQFGNARLPYRVLDVFTTLVVEARPEAVERHFQRLKPHYPHLDRAYLASRLQRKGEWAFQELDALLAMGLGLGRDVFAIKGSYAGAFGIPQFLPSSFHRWAVDGNGDQQVDLDNLEDAVASIANYLRGNGWMPNASLKQKMRAVWEYNNSNHYVDAIFAIRHRLDLPSRKSRKPKPPRPAKKPAATEKPPAQEKKAG